MRSKKQLFYATLGLSFFLLFATALVKLIRVQESQKEIYYTAKESRRGKIRTAKEQREPISLRQERLGIMRQVWVDDRISRVKKGVFFGSAPRRNSR